MGNAEVGGVIISLLSADWDSTNTDSVTPTIGQFCDYINLDLSGLTGKTYVLVYDLKPGTQRANGSGTGTKETENTVKIDIRSMISRDHALHCLQEVERILENHQTDPHTDYQLLDPYGDSASLNDEYYGLWHYTKICTLINTNEPAGGS
jgi:hypothetical protein